MKKVALFLFLSVCFAQQSCSSDSVGTEPEENPQDILFKDDFNFSTKKYGRKKLMNRLDQSRATGIRCRSCIDRKGRG